MKIIKELKFATFEWDEENKSFCVTDKDGNSITLNKIYGFALMRFIIRIAQKNFLRKPLNKPNTLLNDDLNPFEEIKEIEEEYEDPNQEKFNFA